MIQLTHQQLLAMKASKVKQFSVNLAFYIENMFPDWCATKSKDDIQHLVLSMMELAKECNLELEESIKALIHHKIELNFQHPLPEYQRGILRNINMSEGFRLQRFYDQVISKTELVKVEL